VVKFREKQIWPFAVASAAFLIAVAAHLIEIFRIDRGVQLFALDDAYIHAAIAKNLLLNHTFGISAGIFASASSSIIWPFLIAALFYVFGLHAWAILLFNIVLGIIALLLCHTVWRSFAPVASGTLETIVLLAIIFAGSLISLAFVGMEHILQFIAVLLFLYEVVLAAGITPPEKIPRGLLVGLCLSGILAVLARFEGAFAIAVGCSFLFMLKRRSLAVSLSLTSALPILLFGWYSVRHGGYFFPNSLLIKAIHGRGKLDGIRNLMGESARRLGPWWTWLFVCVLLLICGFFLKKALRIQAVQVSSFDCGLDGGPLPVRVNRLGMPLRSISR